MKHFYAREKIEYCNSIQYGIWIDGRPFPMDTEDLEQELPDFAVHYPSGLFPGIQDIPMYLVSTYAQ